MFQHFGIIPIYPGGFLGAGELDAIIGGYLRALEPLGGDLRRETKLPDDEQPFFLLVATGGSEEIILDFWKRRSERNPAEPLFLIAHPGNNSLPAALEVLARLQQEGGPGRIFYLTGPDDTAGLEEIASAAQDLGVRQTLRRSRIGLLGAPSNWLVASCPEPETVRTVWGPTVVPVSMDEVVEAQEAISEADITAHISDLTQGATEIREPSATDLLNVGRVSLALRRIVDSYELDALTLRCFDLVCNQRTTGCFGLAQLTDEGLIAGCEGDLVSTVGLLWAHALLETTPWMANPAQLDPGANTLWLAHCTVPRTMVDTYRLRSHFESGIGVGIQGTFPLGPVTLLRLGGPAMDRLWLAEGVILRSGNAENLCRTQVEIRLTAGATVENLLRAPLGNHIVLVFGHHRDRLQRWWKSFVYNDAYGN